MTYINSTHYSTSPSPIKDYLVLLSFSTFFILVYTLGALDMLEARRSGVSGMDFFLGKARTSLNAAARAKGTLDTYIKNFGNYLHWVSTSRYNGFRTPHAYSLLGDPSFGRLRERMRCFAAWESARSLTGKSIKTVLSGVAAIMEILHPSLRSEEALADGELSKIIAAANKHNPSSRKPFLPWCKCVIESLYEKTTQCYSDGVPRYGEATFLHSSAVWVEFLLAARPGAVAPPAENPSPVLFFDSAIITNPDGHSKKYMALIGADGGSKTRKHGAADLVEPPLPELFWRVWRRLISVAIWGRVLKPADLEQLDIFGEDPRSRVSARRLSHAPVLIHRGRVITQGIITRFLRKALMECHSFTQEQADRFSLRGGRTGCCNHLRSLGWSISDIARVCNHKVISSTAVYLKTARGTKMRGTRRLKKKGAAGQDWLTQWSTEYPKRPLPKSLREAIQWMCEGAANQSAEKRGSLIAKRTRRPLVLAQPNIFRSLRDGKVDPQ